jgi:transcription elongation factor GreA
LGELHKINLDRLPQDRVGLGSKVTLLNLDHDTEVTYELVFPELADLERGLISIASPVGKSLLNRREGDEITIQTPAGTKRFELLALVTLHGSGQS